MSGADDLLDDLAAAFLLVVPRRRGDVERAPGLLLELL